MNRLQAAIGSIVFFFVMPSIIAGVIPYWIDGGELSEPLPFGGVAVVAGLILLAPGLVVLIDSFVRFVANFGTPAPIAPTEHLVVTGWYRFVRNPMYVAVLTIILAQALIFWSVPVLIYAAVIFLTVHLFVIGYEEPTLKQQFPADYPAFVANVPRWVPRLTPWRAG